VKQCEDQLTKGSTRKFLTQTYGYIGLAYSLSRKYKLAVCMFAMASHTAEKIFSPPNPYNFSHVLSLAEIVSFSYADALPFYQRAFELNEGLKNEDSLDKVEHEINRENIIESAINHGLLDFARQTLLTITDFPNNGEKETARLWIFDRYPI